MNSNSRFYFVISGDLDDFRALVSILRGEDDGQLRGMKERLNTATQDLKKELEEQIPPSSDQTP